MNEADQYAMSWHFAMLQILIDNDICTREEFEIMRCRKHAWIDQGNEKDKKAAGESDEN